MLGRVHKANSLAMMVQEAYVMRLFMKCWRLFR